MTTSQKWSNGTCEYVMPKMTLVMNLKSRYFLQDVEIEITHIQRRISLDLPAYMTLYLRMNT